MKIARIALKGFRAYHDAEVSFDEPLNVVRGANHSGKTTLKQALELTIARRSDGTTAAGAGADDKIRQGEKKATVGVGIETRQGPVALEMIQKAGSRNYSMPGPFEEYLQANKERWSCCLDPEYFISRPEAEQKAILSALIAPSEYEFDSDVMALVEKHIGAILEELTTPIEQIEWCYSRAFKLRTEAKARLEAIRIPTLPEAPQYTTEKIQEYINKLQDELGADSGPAPQVIDNAAAIARNQERTRQKQQELRAAQEDLDSARERIADCDKQMLSGPQMTKFKKVAEGRARYEEYGGVLAMTRAKIKALRGSIEDVSELTAEGECPTCTRLLDDEIRDEVIATLEKRIAGLVAIENEQMSLQKDLGDIAGAEAKIAEHERAKAQKLEWVKRQTAAGEKITAIGKEIVTLNNELAQLESNQQVAEATPAKDTTDIKAKLEAWQKKLVEATTYETRQEQITAAEASRKAHAAAVDELERLCSYFGKDGVKAQIIKESITEFTSVVNGVLAYWGYACELSVEPYRFMVTTASGRTLPLKELSGSERLFFGAALQSAIAIQSGIRLVVIDRADTLIDEDRGALFSALTDLISEGQLDQAIVLVADNRTEVPEQSGVAFYRAGDGKVERLGQRAEVAA